MAERTSSRSDEPLGSPFAPGWGFWLWWVLASTAGWVVGGPLGVAVSSSRDTIAAGSVVVAASVGVVGVLQWLVLRRQVARAGWWVLACIGAVAVIGVVVFAVRGIDAGEGVAVGGVVLGALQWLVLRRQVARAGWWVLASTVGWVMGGFLSGAFDGGFAGWATIGAVYGAITGMALLLLLRQ